METDFKVKVGEFEGPLELLLELIEKRKLHISNVAISAVADDFIEYTKSFENFPLADSADFILIASTLLLIKSKSLLPTLDLSTEEEQSIDELEKRLATYKQYKELATEVGKLFGNFLYFAREKKMVKVVFSPTYEITPDTLHHSLREVLQNLQKTEAPLPKISVAKVVSLEEMIGTLAERVQKSLRTSFKDFAGLGKAERVHVIVSFLAMLELVKQGLVRASQENHFDDIEMESDNISIPSY